MYLLTIEKTKKDFFENFGFLQKSVSVVNFKFQVPLDFVKL